MGDLNIFTIFVYRIADTDNNLIKPTYSSINIKIIQV